MGEFEIRLENVAFYAHHGLFEHERHDGNEFVVNLAVRYIPEGSDISVDLEEENIDTTISYVDLFNIVKEEMDRPRKLLETLAREISERIKREFPQSRYIECNIKKTTPPITGFIGSASVTFRLGKE